jgi:hypothetical protein
MGVIYKGLRREGRVKSFTSYQETGVHLVSRRAIRGWFRDAGMRVEKVSTIAAERAEGKRWPAFGMLNRRRADGFIAVAKGTSDVFAG